MRGARLSKNFGVSEARCHDGTALPKGGFTLNAEQLAAEVLEVVRERWGGPLRVVSWYRTGAWNTAVGGARDSTHLTAQGSDVAPSDPDDVAELCSAVEELITEKALEALGGFGKYLGWIHLDTRQVGHLRRWSGRGMGSEPIAIVGAQPSEEITATHSKPIT